jgi:hypothetical protein
MISIEPILPQIIIFKKQQLYSNEWLQTVETWL